MNESKIVDLYSNKNKSTYDIAQMLNTYPNKIRRVLIKHGVDIKDKSSAQKNAIKNGRSKIPTQGKKRTREERLKISKSLSENWKKMDDKTYERRVKSAKDRWIKLSDQEKEDMRQSAIQAIRVAGKEGSKLEKFLKLELSRCGHKVEIHKKNIIPNENLEIDLYVPGLKTVIEVDGPSHFLPIWGEEKLQKQIKADSNKTGLILSKGFVIIRIKHLSDSLSLSKKENLKNKIVKLLESIDSKFPKKSERYIEIDA